MNEPSKKAKQAADEKQAIDAATAKLREENGNLREWNAAFVKDNAKLREENERLRAACEGGEGDE